MTRGQGKHEDKKLTQSADHHHHSLPSERLVSHAKLRRHPSVHAAVFPVEVRFWARLLIARLAQPGFVAKYFHLHTELFLPSRDGVCN